MKFFALGSILAMALAANAIPIYSTHEWLGKPVNETSPEIQNLDGNPSASAENVQSPDPNSIAKGSVADDYRTLMRLFFSGRRADIEDFIESIDPDESRHPATDSDSFTWSRKPIFSKREAVTEGNPKPSGSKDVDIEDIRSLNSVGSQNLSDQPDYWTLARRATRYLETHYKPGKKNQLCKTQGHSCG